MHFKKLLCPFLSEKWTSERCFTRFSQRDGLPNVALYIVSIRNGLPNIGLPISIREMDFRMLLYPISLSEMGFRTLLCPFLSEKLTSERSETLLRTEQWHSERYLAHNSEN